MKRNFKKAIYSSIFAVIAFLVICFIGTPHVFAATTLRSYNYSGSVASWGGRWNQFDYLEGMSANYVKVVVNTSGGDNYDLRLVYYTTFPSERKILATKGSIHAAGDSRTIYFIPQSGSCPSSDSSNCVRVPVVSQISDSTHAVSFYDVMYGIEFYNGSLLGGTLNVSGTYSFVNYWYKWICIMFLRNRSIVPTSFYFYIIVILIKSKKELL